MSLKNHGNALPKGYRLHWYRIESLLGQGGFGITYLAHDTNLDKAVAIKEYLPIELAVREGDSTVRPFTEDRRDQYTWGLTRFIDEARTLANFDHPNIVRVHSVFEANDTAYMVMAYEVGKTLEDLAKFARLDSEAALLAITHPLIDALEGMHASGFIHRDVKPANIVVRPDGTPVLLDFGSARLALGGETRTLTSVVSAGYAPYEQYQSAGGKQGPWTDIYGLGATLYAAINRGRGPLDAIVRGNARIEGTPDPMESAMVIGKGRYSNRFLDAIAAALGFTPAERPQTMAEFRALMPTRDVNSNDKVMDKNSATPVPASPPPAEEAPTLVRDVDVLKKSPSAAQPEATAVYKGPHPRAATPAETSSIPPAPSRVGFKLFLLVLLVGIWIFLWNNDETGHKPSTRAPAQSNSAATPATTQNSASAVTSSRQKSATIAQAAQFTAQRNDAQQTSRQIAVLLAGAADDVQALRLTSPQGNNAVEKYREVLSLDPQNQGAHSGLNAVVNRYITLAHSAAKDENFDKATGYLSRAESVLPGAESVQAARTALQDQQAEIDLRAKLDAQAASPVRAAQQQRKADEAARLADAQLQATAAALFPEANRNAPGTVFRDTLKDGSKGPEMVVVPAGSFRMGDLQGGGDSDEKPVHDVRISRPFAIGKYEVSFAEYDRFATASNRKLPGDNGWGRDQRPVIDVSWKNATAYAEWLSAQTGKRYRLPSEAQWEYAARAGSTTARFWGNDPDKACRYANVHDSTSKRVNTDFTWTAHNCDDGYAQTAPRGRFAANAFGLHDMLGNVWEWTVDCVNESYEGAPGDGSVWVQGDCARRVIRGGSWSSKPGSVRSASRGWDPTVNRGINLGFRLAQDI